MDSTIEMALNRKDLTISIRLWIPKLSIKIKNESTVQVSPNSGILET